MEKKSLFLGIILSIIIISCNSVFAEVEPNANITPNGGVSFNISSTTPSDWNSSYGYYLLQGYNYNISCNTSSSGGAIGAFWYYNNYYNNYYNITMTPQSSTVFSCTFSPTNNHYNPAFYNSTPCYSAPKKLYYQVLNSAMNAGNVTKIGCDVTRWGLSTYTSIDSGFYFNSALSNPIYGPGTGTDAVFHGTTNTYNCLAYSVGIYSRWEMPTEWYETPIGTYNNKPLYGPTLADLEYYMEGYYPDGTSRSGNKFYNSSTSFVNDTTKVIYYKKIESIYYGGTLVAYQHMPHFSLVRTYNTKHKWWIWYYYGKMGLWRINQNNRYVL